VVVTTLISSSPGKVDEVAEEAAPLKREGEDDDTAAMMIMMKIKIKIKMMITPQQPQQPSNRVKHGYSKSCNERPHRKDYSRPFVALLAVEVV
jgi:hypothetical protein